MKKKSGKRFLSWLLAAVMIITLMPATAFAEPPTESSGNTEPAVTAYCPSSEGGTDVSVEGYDSSPAAETKNTPTEEPAKDTPAEEPAKDTPAEEPAKDTPAEEPVKDTPAEEPVKDTPAEEPVKESPVADKTTEDTPAQEGAVENSTDEKIIEDSTNEASAADLAGLTAMFGAPELLELYTSWYYPVYVYGCFKHNGKNLDKNAALYINDNETAIKWNGDASKGEYYITFGKLTDATGSNPLYYTRYNSGEVPKWEIPTNDIETRITNGEVDLASKDTEGSAQKNGLATTGADVNKYVKGNWSGLKPRKGAEGFPETGTKWSWHIDGTIDVYRVTYTRGNLPENEEFTPPKESTYFLDDYTVRGQKPTSQNYRFTGWKYKGVTYNQGDKVPASKQDITLTAEWEKKEKIYTVNYEWDGTIPSDLSTPSLPNPNEFTSMDDVYNAKDTTYVEDYTHTTTDGTYTFSGWTENVGTTDYSGDKIVTPITYKGTWTFEAKPVTNYKVAYKWADDSPKDVDLPAKDDTIYDSPADVLAAVNNVDTTSFKSTEPRQGVAGTWKFDKWEKSSSSDSTVGHVTTTTITYTGTWTFTPTPVTNYKVAYAWDMNAPTDVDLPAKDDTIYDSPEAVLAAVNKVDTTNFKSTEPRQGVAGTWTFNTWTEDHRTEAKDGHVTTITITYIGTWNFTPSETKTITDVLNSLVWKKFESQHGYSTSGTFTAIAKVMPVHPEINSYAAEVDVSSDNNTNTPGTDNAKTFTGTVNLKTGETRAFNFSAGKGVADELDPYTYYEVRVSEVEGNLSKVTYDTTKYILTFTTDRNAVVDYIGIAKQDNGEAFPELAPIEDDKPITFQNIYTYKRSHSSGDSGNGGGKKEEKPTVEIKDDDALGLNNTDHFAYIVGYGNGEVRPQNSITRAEVAAIFFRLLEDDVRDANYTRQNKFTDVSNDAWYCSAVSTLSAMGIISGYPDATFRPNASITRAEFAAIATRFDVNGDKTPASFNDIADHWAKDEIAVAANNGWVNGYEDGSFRPQNKITRAETMSLVNRVLNRKPETAEDLLENMTKWTDNADTNAWYYLAVQEATNSHYYEYKENSQYEKWTELRETRDWSELDK